jgi:hypothetical protein
VSVIDNQLLRIVVGVAGSWRRILNGITVTYFHVQLFGLP